MIYGWQIIHKTIFCMLNRKNVHDEIMNSALSRISLVEAYENGISLKLFYSGITNSCCEFIYQQEVIVVI